METTMSEFIIGGISVVVGVIIGHFLTTSNALREQKAKVYGDILPTLLMAVYRQKKQKSDITQLNQAISKLWLYSDKEVAKSMDKALGIMANLNEANVDALTKELKNTVKLMRNDIQLPWKTYEQELDPDEFTHLYFDEGV